MTRLRFAFWSLVIGQCSLMLAACNIVPVPPPPVRPVTLARLVVDSDGLYEVPASALQAVGFDLAAVSPDELALSAGGQDMPFLLVGEGRKRALRFYGQALGPSAYTGQNVYWLQQRKPGGPQVPIRVASPPGESRLAELTSASVRVEEQRQYVPKVGPGDDPWLWESLFAPGQVEIMIATPHPAPGESILRVQVWGNSSAPTNPDHHLVLSLNATPVADVSWDGRGGYAITATVPAGVLLPGENRLMLQAPGDTGAPADVVLLDWAEITYPRALVAEEGGLVFGGQAAGFTVRTTGEPLALWDITNPALPVALSDYQVERGVVRFASDGTPRRFSLVTQAGLRHPVAVSAARSPDLHAWPGGADIIIVTVPEFREALQPLVAARQAAGLRVAVVDVGAIYDNFNHGRADPAAIRAFVHFARAHWTPPAARFLLLAGDASYDPRGYLGGSEVDLVPTRLVETTFTGWTASDVWYALPDDTPSARPALAVGRFPAQTPGQLAAMVAKTLAYEQDHGAATLRQAQGNGPMDQLWWQRALFVADNDEPDFAAEAQAFADRVPEYTSELITVAGDGTQARAGLLQAFAAGVGLIGYFGHGSLTVWAREQIFGVGDVPKLANREKLPIVFTVTCLNGFFQHPSTPALGEALLRTQGGAVATLVPSSAALLVDQRLLARELAQALAANDGGERTLGEVIQQALTSLPQAAGEVREILLTFNLLGDPALRLR